MVICHRCKAKVPDIGVCTACGAANPGDREKGPNVWVFAIGLFVVAGILKTLFSPDAPNTAAHPAARPAPDPQSLARTACRLFLEQSSFKVNSLIDEFNWSVVDNGDGTFGVGTRFVGFAPGSAERSLYVTCTVRRTDGNWQLVRLTRLR